MPPKKAKKPRKPRVARSATEKKKGLKQKQKQKQQVNVNVSSGGGGGSGYIPIPQAPEINYSLLSQLIRPAATVDVPIRAQVPVPEAAFVRPAEPPSLAGEVKAKRTYTKKPKPIVVEGFVSGTKPMASSRDAFTVGGGNSSKVQFASSESESERDLRMPDNSSIPIFADPYKNMSSSRDTQYYRSSPSAFIPEGGIGKGKKTKYETDIFGRDMPMTSSISASPSFEVTGGGSRRNPNIVSYLDLPSGGESEVFGRRAYDKMKSSSRFS